MRPSAGREEDRPYREEGALSGPQRRAQACDSWSEWCLTEDSELAIRIHAAGYTSHYAERVYGRGLIPETFAGYRRQRHRWSAGPVQELYRHWRLYLPVALGGSPVLTPAQKLHHLNHGTELLVRALGLLVQLLPVAAGGRCCSTTTAFPHHRRCGCPARRSWSGNCRSVS